MRLPLYSWGKLRHREVSSQAQDHSVVLYLWNLGLMVPEPTEGPALPIYPIFIPEGVQWGGSRLRLSCSLQPPVPLLARPLTAAGWSPVALAQ